MMRVGLVGLGDAGRHHGRALLRLDAESELQWTALCARSAETTEAFRTQLNVPERVACYGSLEDLLASKQCDAIILATPDAVHAEQVVRAARAGVHVLVEKPLALTLADAERAIESARKANVQLMVGYHLRHHAGHRAIVARQQELLGDLRRMSLSWAWPDPAVDGWRARGEALFWSLAALGTHCIDLALWASGATEVSEVVALTRPSRGVDRAAEVTLRLGQVFTHVSVSVEERAISRWILSGTGGELESIGTLGARGDGQILHRLGRAPAATIDFQPVNPYAAQLRDFVQRAQHGFEEDHASMLNLEVLEQVALGRWIRDGSGHGA